MHCRQHYRQGLADRRGAFNVNREVSTGAICHVEHFVLQSRSVAIGDLAIHSQCSGTLPRSLRGLDGIFMLGTPTVRKHAARAALWLSISASSFSTLVVRQ